MPLPRFDSFSQDCQFLSAQTLIEPAGFSRHKVLFFQKKVDNLQKICQNSKGKFAKGCFALGEKKGRSVWKMIFSQEGYRALQEAIEKAKEELDKVRHNKGEAGRGQDTWHDEGFKLGTMKEFTYSKRLGELQVLAREAKIIDSIKLEEQAETVKFGNGVVLEEEDGSIRKFVLEGYRVDAPHGHISVQSHLGKALILAKVGEKRSFAVEGSQRIVKIIKIIPPSRVKALLEEGVDP